MARGELADPVTAGGDGDEVGRLTFALEEMRRALRDKLRSTEEVNLDLERAVQRRTHDLAKKNKELAETLDKLTRTQPSSCAPRRWRRSVSSSPASPTRSTTR